jgi:hypothetical protein
MYGTRTPRWTSGLTLKGKRLLAKSRTRWFSQILENIKKRGKSRGRKMRLGSFHPATCIK